jgi:lipoprotein-anchoring transpeptidase ErfK/SrfK
MKSILISRRNLIKLGVAGSLASIFPARATYAADLVRARAQTLEPGSLVGLSLAGGTVVRSEPNLKASKVKALKRDEVLVIEDDEVVESTSGSNYNKRWYKVEGGYVHSANFLPVPNTSGHTAISAGEIGFWAELSVPYFDVRTGPSMSAGKSKYRYYGGTVYKVRDVVQAEEVPDVGKMLFGAIDENWYSIEDEQFPGRYFVPASYMRVIVEEDIAPISPDVGPEDKSITVNLKEQRMVAYEKGKEVLSGPVATGKVFKAGNFSTPKGDWFVYRKTPSQHMWGGAVGNEGSFDLPGIPWVSYFVTTGVAFHGTYWHNDFGLPRSHGCVNLPSETAKWVFRWTMPYPDYDPKKWYTQAPWRKPDFTKVTRVKVV